jgi:lysophospholipase L1-like esterase
MKKIYVFMLLLFFVSCGKNTLDTQNNQTDINSQNNLKTLVPMIFIGDSTLKLSYKDKDGNKISAGWAEKIGELVKDKTQVYNRANSGESSKSYTNMPSWATADFWGDGKTLNYNKKGTKQLINELDTSNGGFLFIQFGHNDAAIHADASHKKETAPIKNIFKVAENGYTLEKDFTSYEEELKKYIDYALLHNITPVLVQPVSRMTLGVGDCSPVDTNIGELSCGARHKYYIDPRDRAYKNNPFQGQTLDYPKAMQDLKNQYAEQGKKVLLLKLTKRSMDYYKNLAGSRIRSEASVYVRSKIAYKGTDQTHFSPSGALEIAKLVVELIKSSGDEQLIWQFK